MTKRYPLAFVSYTVVLSALLLLSSGAFSAELPASAIGTVNGTKDAFVRTAFGSWIPLEGKTYPVVDGTSLKSGKGVTALTTKDLAKIQGGRDSEFVIRGAKGIYTIELQKGPFAFRIPAEVTLTVATPTATVRIESNRGEVTKASRDPKNDRYGVVIFDGKGTKIASLNGSMSVVSLNGSSRQVLTKGSTVYVSGSDEGFRITLAQLAQDEEAKLVSPFVLAAEEPWFIVPLWWLPGSEALLAGAAAIPPGGGDDPVSPIKP
jgi:hypothetical protein